MGTARYSTATRFPNFLIAPRWPFLLDCTVPMEWPAYRKAPFRDYSGLGNVETQGKEKRTYNTIDTAHGAPKQLDNMQQQITPCASGLRLDERDEKSPTEGSKRVLGSQERGARASPRESGNFRCASWNSACSLRPSHARCREGRMWRRKGTGRTPKCALGARAPSGAQSATAPRSTDSRMVVLAEKDSRTNACPRRPSRRS